MVLAYQENGNSKGHRRNSSNSSIFYVDQASLEMTPLTDATLTVGEEAEPVTPPSPTTDPKNEEILKDVLYSVECLMSKSGKWKVSNGSSRYNISSIGSSPINGMYYSKGSSDHTTVTLEEVVQYLGDVFRTDQATIQGLRDEARQRKLAEFCLNLTVLEADIQCQKDATEPINSHVRIKTGGKASQEYSTPQMKGTRHPKWKHPVNVKLSDLYNDHIQIELWHEKEDEKRRKRDLMRGIYQDPTKRILLAESLLPLKDTLDRGITGWHKLDNRFGTNMKEPTKVQLSGHISCTSEVECDALEAYDNLLKCVIDHQKEKSSQNDDQIYRCGESNQGSLEATARAVLSLYALILNLSPDSQLLSWWNNVTVLATPLDWHLLLRQFEIIKHSLVKGLYSDKEQQYFGQAVSKVIIDRCINCVKNLEDCFPVAFPDTSKTQLKCLLQVMTSIQEHPKLKPLMKERNEFCLRNVIKTALQGFSRQWWNKMADRLDQCSETRDDQLRTTLMVTKELCVLLNHLSQFYDNVFMKEFDICCLKVVYQTIVKEMMETVGPIVMDCCQAIPVSEQLIEEYGMECDFLIGSDLMKIYKHLIWVWRFRCPHFSPGTVSVTGVEEYHKLFECGVAKQLTLTTNREYNVIKDITHKDDLRPVGPQTLFSASLLEVTAIPHRVKIWWFELVWPDNEDRAVQLIQVLKSLLYLSISYCEHLVEKMDYILQDLDSNSQQLINEKVCVTITNMENMVKEIKLIPNILGYQSLEDKTNGKYTEEIASLMEVATHDIKTMLQTFTETVIDKRKEFLERSIMKSCQEDGGDVTFLRNVLHPTIDLLRKLLKVSSVQKFLECLWNSIITIMGNIIIKDPAKDPDFYGGMLRTLQKVFMDLTPDSEEALDAQSVESMEYYTSLVKDLKLMERRSSSLIRLYYQERHEYQHQDSAPPSASLVIRTWFKEGNSKLAVNVLMARNIVVPAAEAHKAPLEYYVNVQILLDENQQPTEKTPIIKADPATFEKEFEFNLNNSDEDIQGGILLLTLKDNNLTRSNTFLGEAVVPFVDIITQEDTGVQNMYLKMTVPTFCEGCPKILQILARRDSDKQAAAFLKKLRKKHPGACDLLKNLQ